MGLRKLAATALLLLVLFNLVSAPVPRMPTIAERYCLNSPFASHPASWYAVASQIDSFEPPVINSPATGSSIDYESQPINLNVLVHGRAAGYSVAVQESTLTTQLGTALNNSATIFALPSLAAGTHSLQVQATASLQLCGLHHSNTETSPLSLTITKSTPTLTITITPSTTVSPGTETHATCTSSTPQATPQLRRDGTPAANPDVAALPLGTYEYTCSAAETQNYTSASATPVTLIADTRTPTTTTVTINGAGADASVPYGDAAVLAASTSAGSVALYLNGTSITSPSTLTLAAGTYNVTAINFGDADHFASSATHWLTVNKATPTLTLTATPATTVTYGAETTVSCTASTPQVTPTQTRDSAATSNPEVRTLAGGSYAYACTSAATQNYTPATATPLTLIVNRAATTTTLTINGVDADQTITYGAPATLAASTSTGSLTLYVNGTPVTNPTTLTLAAGSYNVTATNAGDANHSASTATHWLTINKATATLALTLNGADADQTIDAGTTANVRASLSTTGNVQITENAAVIASGPSPQTIARTPSVGTYNYTATYAGNTNYTTASASHVLTVRDLTAPTVSGLAWTYANGSMGTAGSITWTTDENANSTIYYGNTSGSYTSTLNNASFTINHNQTLANLDANTTYYYLIQSCDSTANCANTTQNTLTTPPAFELIASTGLDSNIQAITSFNGLLYIGTNTPSSGHGRILTTSDGITFTPAYTASDRRINTFGVLDSKLYAGTGSTYGQLLRRNTDGSWTNLVNFTAEKRIEAIAEYYYAPDGITYRYLGMWNGTTTGTQAHIYYNPDTWGTDAVWDVYATPWVNKVNSFAVFGDQIYAGLNSVGWEDMWCNKGYLLGCTPYRGTDARGMAWMRLAKYNDSILTEASQFVPALFQNTSDTLNWNDTMPYNPDAAILSIGKCGPNIYGVVSVSGGAYTIYKNIDGAAMWKAIYSGIGAIPVLAEYNGKIYFGSSNAGGTQGYLLRST